MFRVKSNLDVNGKGWGLDFKHGVAYTERDDLARRLRSLGYEVEEVKQDAPAAETEATAEPVATTSPAEVAAEKPFICSICGRPFGNQASLTKHTNKMHS